MEQKSNLLQTLHFNLLVARLTPFLVPKLRKRSSYIFGGGVQQTNLTPPPVSQIPPTILYIYRPICCQTQNSIRSIRGSRVRIK